MLLGADSYDVLEHSRSSVSYLEALGSVDMNINTILVTAYSEMQDITRDAHDAERDPVEKNFTLQCARTSSHDLTTCFKEVPT